MMKLLRALVLTIAAGILAGWLFSRTRTEREVDLRARAEQALEDGPSQATASAAGDGPCVEIAAAEVGASPDSNVLRAAAERRGRRAVPRPLHAVCVGMHRDEAQAAWGMPQGMLVQRRGDVRYAEWQYPAHTVFLRDSIVMAIR